MFSNIISRYVSVALVCFLVFLTGCGDPGVNLSLKFVPADTTTYRLVTEKVDSITFEGDLGNAPEFKDQTRSSRFEMTFVQKIQQIDEKGNATAKITIKDLKWKTMELNKTKLDFDSAQVKSKRNPLARLIGQSYTIKIAPTGRIVRIVSTVAATAAVKDKTVRDNMALLLIKPPVIKNRHEITALPSAKKNPLKQGGTWSVEKKFDFRMMGKKTYERIYTFNEIYKSEDGEKIAIIEMKAIPAVEDQQGAEQPDSAFLDAFDNIEEYTGLLKLDLNTGKINFYSEKLRTEWIIVDPMPQKEGKEPVTMKMTAVRTYNLERID